MSRNTCNSENGEKSPEGWRFKLDVKSGPLESGDFGKNDKFGCREWWKIARGLAIQIRWQKWPLEKGRFWLKRLIWRVAIFAKLAISATMAKFCKNCKFGANSEKSPEGWQYPECGKYSNWKPKVAPSNLIIKEIPIIVRQHFSKKCSKLDN